MDTPTPTLRRLRPLALFLAALAVLVLASTGLLAWLALTESGLKASASLAETVSGGRLALTPAGGRLAGPLRLREAVWRSEGLAVRASDVSLDWEPAALLQGRLQVNHLTANCLQVETSPDRQPPPSPPTSLRLPLAVNIETLAVDRLEKGGFLVASGLQGRLESDGIRHRAAIDRARAGLADLAGDSELQGDAPFPLRIRATASGRWQGKALSLAIQATGHLADIAVTGQASGELQGNLAARLTPFHPRPVDSLEVHLKNLDPSAWIGGAPAARLDVDADLRPQAPPALAAEGYFAISNRTPGPLAARKLPITEVSGRIDLQGDNARFGDLRARLPGDGSLAGNGSLAGRRLELHLQARQLDAAVFHPRLHPTRLEGSVTLAATPESQSLTARLTDRRLGIALRLDRQGDRIAVEELELRSGPARLSARGRLTLDEAYSFEARGTLADFDPRRFLKAPAARLNANLETSGTLKPQPRLRLAFELRNSRLHEAPLAGTGALDLDWPLVRQADIALAAGPNRLTARGAFGRAGDRLALTIDAPRLDPYGIEGDLRGDLTLTGTAAAPAVVGRLQSARLGLPGGAHLREIELTSTMGARPGDPLRVTARIAAGGSPQEPNLFRRLSLIVDGSRARHDLRAGVELTGDRQLALAAAGGLGEGPAWNGQLLELSLASPRPEGHWRLLKPATLDLGKEAWRLGPAELEGPEWRGHLQASAAGSRLLAEASGSGPRLGTIDARLEARLLGAWTLAANEPWQGRLTLEAADIAWLGPLLGEDWVTSGRLEGKIRLAGTPARPDLSGRLKGDDLGLRSRSPGLWLEDGRLLAEFQDDRLRIETLAFDSRLRPPPVPLARAGGPEVAGLAASPGRLTVGGEIRLEPGGAPAADEEAVLHVIAERVGIFQEADQWVAVSGQGDLRWRGGALASEARLRVDGGYWELAGPGMPRLSDDVVVRPRPGSPLQSGQRATRVALDAEIDLGPHFYFAGAGLESRLAGSLRIKAAARDLPRATGTIQTVQGKFDAYGQKLAVERGIVNFQGFLDDPGLNVRAVRRGLPVEAGVEVSGTVKRPVVRLVSDPELPEAEKLSWLVLGHGSEQAGSQDATTLVNAATAILGKDASGGLLQRLQRQFGVEEFGLRRGQLGDTGERQATSRVVGSGSFTGDTAGTGGQIVTVSKRLASNVLLSYEQALGRTENIVKLTVNLTRRLSVIGRAGSDNAIDLFYTFSFGK